MNREGVFVISIYADRKARGCRGEMKRMVLFPSGAVTGAETVGIVLHLLEVQSKMLLDLLNRFEESEEVCSLDEDGLAAAEPERGQGFVFDATA